MIECLSVAKLINSTTLSVAMGQDHVYENWSRVERGRKTRYYGLEHLRTKDFLNIYRTKWRWGSEECTNEKEKRSRCRWWMDRNNGTHNRLCIWAYSGRSAGRCSRIYDPQKVFIPKIKLIASVAILSRVRSCSHVRHTVAACSRAEVRRVKPGPDAPGMPIKVKK